MGTADTGVRRDDPGRIGSPAGAVAGAVLLGIAQELSVPLVGPSYNIAVAFAVLLLVLLVRPRGLFGVALTAAIGTMEAYLVAVAVIALIYMLLAIGLNLQYGYTGLVNFGHVAFYAIGAYASRS